MLTFSGGPGPLIMETGGVWMISRFLRFLFDYHTGAKENILHSTFYCKTIIAYLFAVQGKM